jgi:hypothetical protein
MKERILYNWHSVRVVYLVIGVLISVYAIVTKEWTGFLPGAYFMSMAVFHFGCATGGCYVAPIKNAENKTGSTEPAFEEIK